MLITQLGILKYGSRGVKVVKLQQTLEQAGHSVGPYGTDGIIGNDTDRAIRKFQKEHGLKVDGIAGPNTLYELMWYAYPNFKKQEFKCKCGGVYCNGYHTRVDEYLVWFLQRIADHYQRAVIITSGLRCPEYDVKIGGIRGQHSKGTAADIKVEGVSAQVVYVYCDIIVGKDGGVGRYNTHTHIDTRGTKARWDHR